MKFGELMRMVGGEVVRGAGVDIRRVVEDSRKVEGARGAGGDLFVARTGTRVSGASFAREAVRRGAVAVVTEEEFELEGVAMGRVKDAGLAMALLAHAVAGHPTAGMKMVAITGTKGKTTTAYLLRAILRAAGHKTGMIGTVEIDDGAKAAPADMTTPGPVELAEMFARMRANGVTHCVMEVSSHALHQGRVSGVEFAVGCFTNLTGDHLDYHKTMEAYAAAKALLFEGMKEGATAVVNGDDAWAKRMAAGCKGKVVEVRVETREGGGKEASTSRSFGGWVGRIERMTSVGMEVRIEGPGEAWTLPSPLVGRHNVYNTLCAAAAAAALGVGREAIAEGLGAMAGVPGRLEAVVPAGWTRGDMPFQVLVDYAHTHDALENVLTAVRATMSSPSSGGRLICVFGCGGDRDRTKRPKMGAVAERLADVVVVTSDNPRTEDPGEIIREICAGFSAGWEQAGGGKAGRKVQVEADRRAAIGAAIGMAEAGDVVVIAGKGHEDYQIVGLEKTHFDDVEEAEAALRRRGIGRS